MSLTFSVPQENSTVPPDILIKENVACIVCNCVSFSKI